MDIVADLKTQISPALLHNQSIFNDTLSDLAIRCMQADIDQLPQEEFESTTLTKQDRQCTWLAIAFSHPDASDELLHQLAHKLSLDESEFLLYSVMVGRLSPIDPLLILEAHRLADKLHPTQEELKFFADWFLLAATHGNLSMIRRMTELTPHLTQALIKANDYGAFTLAAQNGQLAVVKHLLASAQPSLWQLFKQGDYFKLIIELTETVGRFIVNHTIIPFVNLFITSQEPKKPLMHQDALAMLHEVGGYAMSEAAANGHLDVVKYLIAQHQLDDSRVYVRAFIQAVEHNQPVCANWLLTIPDVLHYAEEHEREYASYVYPFMQDTMASLQSKEEQCVANNRVFDVPTLREAMTCFFIARRLIRNNDPNEIDELNFILNIPAVRELASIHSSAIYKNNELLLLAQSIGNHEAEYLLLEIPEVARLASEDDPRQNGLALKNTSVNREPSQEVLSRSEQFNEAPQFVNQGNQALALPPKNENQVINCSEFARIEPLFEDKPRNTSSHVEIYSVKKIIPSELNGNLSVRCMTPDDLNLVVDWCKEEGWNIGLYDFHMYYKLTLRGHLMFLYENEPIGAISIIQHSDDFLTIGPFIVKNGYRGKGYGSQIWQQAIALIEQENYTVSLYSVPAQVDFYQKRGFQTKFKNKRWELFHENQTLIKEEAAPCEDFSSDNLLSVSQYDQSIFSISRQKIFEELLKISAVKGFVLKNEGLITGFGLIRPCVKGWRVGPLFANTPESAKIIFTKLLSVVSDEKIIIDVPSANKFAQVFAEYFNLTAVSADDTEAMFTGNEPKQLLEHINENYGVFSLEIG